MRQERDMMNNLSKLILALGSVLCFNSAVAIDGYEVDDQVRNAIEPMMTQDGTTLNYFAGPGGTVGVGVTRPNGQQMVVYVTADGSTVFSGVAIDVESGKNVAATDAGNLPAPDYSALVERVALSTALSEGNSESENHYYVFVDPRCPYCHKTYTAFADALAAGGDFMVHYIPVGILGPESENLAKEMLGTSGDGMDIFRQVVGREHRRSDDLSIANGVDTHGRNLAIFRSMKFDAVPVVVSTVGDIQTVRRGAITLAMIQSDLNEIQKVAGK